MNSEQEQKEQEQIISNPCDFPEEYEEDYYEEEYEEDYRRTNHDDDDCPRCGHSSCDCYDDKIVSAEEKARIQAIIKATNEHNLRTMNDPEPTLARWPTSRRAEQAILDAVLALPEQEPSPTSKYTVDEYLADLKKPVDVYIEYEGRRITATIRKDNFFVPHNGVAKGRPLTPLQFVTFGVRCLHPTCTMPITVNTFLRPLYVSQGWLKDENLWWLWKRMPAYYEQIGEKREEEDD